MTASQKLTLADQASIPFDATNTSRNHAATAIAANISKQNLRERIAIQLMLVATFTITSAMIVVTTSLNFA